ncbi:MAG TPA: amino acid adenylation domain-containing protein, partial [Terriglobales bacterium]
GAPASLDLATDRSRPAEQSFRGAKYTFEVPRDLTDKLQAIGRHENATLFMTLLAAFNILLSRYSGQDDVVVGSPIAGRTRPELEKLIGFFVNTLVLRTHLSSDASFRDLLAQVKETAMGAYAHQDVPFEKLVEELKPERDLSRNPLFQVMFILQNVPTPRHAMGGIEIGGLPLATASSKFDLTLIGAERDGVRLTFEYNTDLFDLSTIERMAEHFQTLLAAVAAKPAARISDLPLLGQAERNKLLVEWNATASDYPRVCVHELFAQQAARTPNAVAVEMGSEKIRYAELNARADLVAQHLRAEGVGPEKLVGIYLERSIEMVVALLAVLKAGGAYIPLDPAYPPERIGFILDDAGVEIVLTESDLLASVPPTQAKKLDVRALLKSPAPNNAPAATASRPENLAYVLYTSGSTGKPKGVQITHANLVNFLVSMQREPRLTADDTLLAVTTLSFDIAGLEIYLPLTTGARILLATRAEASDGRLLLEQIGLRRPTVMQATPATWRMLIEAGWQGTKNLKVLCGGEALPADLAALLLPRCSELWTMYGPTETTIWSSVYRVREVNWTAAPVGRPIANTQMYVLDANGRPTPIGVPGELYIAGDGVARGYFRRPELTAEKFLHDPFSAQPDARMYRTGDLARFLPDGNIQYLGRTDFQVKIRGFRIELGEIESLLAQHPAVQQTVVAAREDSPGDKRLVAYIVPKSGEHLSTTDARAYLRQNLPDYMLPSVVMELEALPLTPNGKVDRKALPKPEVPVRDAQSLIPPRDALESQLLEIWKKILQTQSIGITDNFFDLGGHSIMAARLVMEMEKAVGRKIPLAALFRGPSVESMANLIREGTEAAPDPIVMQIQAGTSIPFFAVVEPGMDAVGYIALAQAMGQQQTFYKLQSHRPMKPDTPITLDDMRGFAREYIKAMQTIQPRGPYFIGGMCAGTHIAEQMVLQL